MYHTVKILDDSHCTRVRCHKKKKYNNTNNTAHVISNVESFRKEEQEARKEAKAKERRMSPKEVV